MTTIRTGRIRLRAKGESGFSMIEVLIALVVLALGLLGFALLQTMNLRYTQSANQRTQATNLAYDLIDQMRANNLAAAQYQAASFAPNSETGANCTRPVGTTSITQNVTRWRCQVAESLGTQSSANVTYAARQVTVQISWGERLAGADANTTFTVSSQL
ncbi:MAG: type IV pilus modification protein PilV [Chloroflexi bacterium]|nr:type IV pilus modification protein PilV [Chloroflexota bacterium]